MEAKNIVKSKTFWTNVLLAVVVPFLPEAMKPSPEVLASAFAIVNVVLRLISKGKVELI